jgi:hypothetical protein
LLWKRPKLTVMQQALLRYYGNAIWCIDHVTKENLICHNTIEGSELLSYLTLNYPEVSSLVCLGSFCLWSVVFFINLSNFLCRIQFICCIRFLLYFTLNIKLNKISRMNCIYVKLD